MDSVKIGKLSIPAIKGEQGEKGDMPIKGVDYLTEEEKNAFSTEIKEDVENKLDGYVSGGIADIEGTKDGVIDAIESQENSSISNLTSQETTSIGNITTAKTTSMQEIQTSKQGALTEMTTAKGTAISSINDAKTASLTAIETAKEEAIEDIQEETLQSQIDSLTEENELFKEQIPLGEVEGDDITITDSSNMPVEEIRIVGRTEQNGTPSPDNPVDIHVVTGECKVVLSSKNLFDKNAFIYKMGYYDDNGQLMSSTATGHTIMKIPVNAETSYTLSTLYMLSSATQSQVARVYYYDENKNWLSRSSLINVDGSYTFTTPANCSFIDLQITVANQTPTFLGKIDEFQIEEGTVVTNYVLGGIQEYPISLGNIELCRTGNYEDYIYGSTDNWYKHYVISKYQFNGTESFSLQNNGKRIFVDYTLNTLKFKKPRIWSNASTKSNLILCNLLEEISAGKSWDGKGQGVSYDNANSGFLIRIEKFTTFNEYKNFFIENKPIVYFILIQSYDERITDPTLISQLNAIYRAKTYKNITNITTEGADLAPTLKITYRKDLETVLNNLQAQILEGGE